MCLFEVCINVGHWWDMIGKTDESRFPMSTLAHAQVYYVTIAGSAGSYQRKELLVIASLENPENKASGGDWTDLVHKTGR